MKNSTKIFSFMAFPASLIAAKSLLIRFDKFDEFIQFMTELHI